MMNRRKNILIVDADKHILEVMRLALANVEIQVVTAADMTEAERAMANMAFDLIVAEMHLNRCGGREGLALLDRIKKTRPETRVIIMTAYGSPGAEQAAYNKGVYLYLTKPFDLRILEQHLEKLGFY